jgi:hypothetical protein
MQIFSLMKLARAGFLKKMFFFLASIAFEGSSLSSHAVVDSSLYSAKTASVLYW